MLGIASVCLLVSVSYFLVRREAGAAGLLDRIWRGKWASVPPLLCSLGVLGFAISPVRAESVKLPSPTHVRSDYFHYRELGDSYLEDFGQLAGELSRRSSDRFRVLATLDLEVMSWWVTFRHGAVLAPDPFSTTLPDAEIEKRLASFGAILGLDAPGFVRFVTQDNDPQKNNALGHNNVVNAFFLSHNKYGGLARWYLTIPPAELERLDRVFQEHARVDRYRVDGLVLFSRGCLAELQPDPRHFSRVFENSTFRLYVANDLVTP